MNILTKPQVRNNLPNLTINYLITLVNNIHHLPFKHRSTAKQLLKNAIKTKYKFNYSDTINIKYTYDKQINEHNIITITQNLIKQSNIIPALKKALLQPQHIRISKTKHKSIKDTLTNYNRITTTYSPNTPPTCPCQQILNNIPRLNTIQHPAPTNHNTKYNHTHYHIATKAQQLPPKLKTILYQNVKNIPTPTKNTTIHTIHSILTQITNKLRKLPISNQQTTHKYELTQINKDAHSIKSNRVHDNNKPIYIPSKQLNLLYSYYSHYQKPKNKIHIQKHHYLPSYKLHTTLQKDT